MRALLRSGIVLALALAGLWAGWRALAHSLADGALPQSPERALAWVGSHPEAMLRLAQRQLRAGELDAAGATAGALVAREPLQGSAWGVLAAVDAAAGDEARARERFAAAARLSPRDPPARRWLAQDHLARGEYPAAVAQLDSMYRVLPEQREQVLSALVQLAADAQFRAALVPALADSPQWRGAFLDRLSWEGEPQAIDALFSALQRDGALGRQERARWEDGLLARGDWGRAYALWAAGVPEDMALRPVYNGDFSRRPGGLGFDWRLPPGRGVAVGFPRSGGARIVYRNRPVEHGGLEQALLLAPGRYVLSVRQRLQGLQAERGLQWAVTCAGSHLPVGQTEAFRGDRDWHEIQADLEVPGDCEGQWLRLQNVSRAAALQRVSGQLDIADVSIARAAAPAAGDTR